MRPNDPATGERNGRWKGGRYVNRGGYIYVRVDGKYRPEHRVIMEKHLGRVLLRGEVVHHRNGRTDDNRIENLEVMERIAHNRMHGKAVHRRGQTWPADLA